MDAKVDTNIEATAEAEKNPGAVTDAKMPPNAESRTGAAQINVLLIVLLLFYSAPVFIALGKIVVSISVNEKEIFAGSFDPKAIFDNASLVTQLLSKLAQEKGKYLGVFHQLLVPVVAAFTAFSFDRVRNSRGASWIFVLPLVVLFFSIGLAVSFSFITNSDNSQEISTLFNSMAENFSIYVLTLFGLEGAYQRKAT
jgi:hypothetical protein